MMSEMEPPADSRPKENFGSNDASPDAPTDSVEQKLTQLRRIHGSVAQLLQLETRRAQGRGFASQLGKRMRVRLQQLQEMGEVISHPDRIEDVQVALTTALEMLRTVVVEVSTPPQGPVNDNTEVMQQIIEWLKPVHGLVSEINNPEVNALVNQVLGEIVKTEQSLQRKKGFLLQYLGTRPR